MYFKPKNIYITLFNVLECSFLLKACFHLVFLNRILFIHFRYIAKSDTLTRDLDYVIQYKLNGHGGTPHLNAARKTVDNTHGRLLPLFSKLERQEYWISKMSEKYREDLEMFGYSYYVNERVVYATCKQYDSSHECI